MKRGWLAFSPDPSQVRRLLWWSVAIFVVPMAVFAMYALSQTQSRQAELVPATAVDLWIEPLGAKAFTSDYLKTLSSTSPPWEQAEWRPVVLPHSVEIAASLDLPVDAPKARAWFRMKVPQQLLGADAPPGSLGALGFRVMGGPWALWVDGKMLHANLADWRIQWNRPLRVSLPLGTQEFFIAVPHAEVHGYAMGSLYLGQMDVVDSAWMERDFWMSGFPTILVGVAALMLMVGAHLSISRRQEPVFALLGINALLWLMSTYQWTHEFTGQDGLSFWFGSVMDSTITWSIVFTCIFAFEYQKLSVPRLRAAMLIYAATSTLVTLPVWDWAKQALLAQQLINVVVFLAGLLVLAANVWRRPNREALVLLVMMTVQLPLGIHTLVNLTSQRNPDQIAWYPFAVLLTYWAFTYAIGRRTVLALNTAEHHEAFLRSQLDEQKRRLAEQHESLQRLEVERRLDTQRDSIMQDLHDRLGSNLTSALLQARKGDLSSQETLLLLQDLAEELHHIGSSATQEGRTLNEILAELRQRVHNRLVHGGIDLIWRVDPQLMVDLNAHSSQHILAMMSEAVANVIKHANASEIRIEALRHAGCVSISVTDNGKGFDPKTLDVGRGLPGMRQRAMAIDATVEFSRVAGGGSQCKVLLFRGVPG